MRAGQELSRGASGLRHLRWGREILASLEAHHEHNPRLTQEGRDAVLAEIVELRALVIALSGAVKPYRDFLERRRVQFRGMQRVGRYLCASATDADERAEGEAILEGMNEVFANLEKRERLPLKSALGGAIEGLRKGIGAIDTRLAKRVSAAFVESIYPELTRGGTIVADAEDSDDDATAGA